MRPLLPRLGSYLDGGPGTCCPGCGGRAVLDGGTAGVFLQPDGSVKVSRRCRDCRLKWKDLLLLDDVVDEERP